LQFGASLVDMSHVQVHPTGLIDPASPAALSKILGPETLRGSGGILVTRNGRRFANELGTRGYLTKSIFELGDDHPHRLESGRVQKTALVILNRKVL
jgi:succinate dehydrogenase/fumarate reductase flavoprotein subunit